MGSVLSIDGGSLLLQRKRRKVAPVNSSLEDFPSKPWEGISAKVQAGNVRAFHSKDVPSTKLLIGSSPTNQERATPPPRIQWNTENLRLGEKLLFPLSELSPRSLGRNEIIEP